MNRNYAALPGRARRKKNGDNEANLARFETADGNLVMLPLFCVNTWL